VHLTADQLVASLRTAGLRITAARRAVCQVLATSHDEHLTAADLHARAEVVGGIAINPSTIYRTIEALEETGHLHHVHFGHGPGVIHLSDRSDHQHLVCEVCGRTDDLPLEELEPFLDAIETRYRFRSDTVHFALLGRCLDHE
jgi:Fur family transcriptional regulator, ferric uptake regulator